jgi:hypothetical protein
MPPLFFGIILGIDKAEPVFIVLVRVICLVVEARIAGFFTELDVPQVRFHGPDPVIDFPCPHQFMQVAGCQFFAVFAHGLEKVHDDFKVFVGGQVIGSRTCAILMGRLHQAYIMPSGFR